MCCIASTRPKELTCNGYSTATPILVPLTPSLYVPGQLASTSTVLVDVGTGFYIEKVTIYLVLYLERTSSALRTPFRFASHHLDVIWAFVTLSA